MTEITIVLKSIYMEQSLLQILHSRKELLTDGVFKLTELPEIYRNRLMGFAFI